MKFKNNTLSFNTNNQHTLSITQEKHDGILFVNVHDNKQQLLRHYEISQGDFVMLLNYYRYCKENNTEIF